MRFSTYVLATCVTVLASCVQSQSTQGLYDLVKRRMPDHVDEISFTLVSTGHLNESAGFANDAYVVSCSNGTVSVEGNSISGLASGLHRYLTDILHVDIYWYIGSQLNLAPPVFPSCASFTGSSIVPWRYHFNTVTFSYTTAFWSWEDWELELDWLALHGVNLPLAWVGIEKILVEAFQEFGLTDPDISDFLSGPAFQSWNRFGNIQGSWGGELPMSWIDGQFNLQKQIIQRMVELGMTPVLPAFPGFVPRAFPDLYPNASVVNGSQWNGFALQYTNDTFLEPQDPLFTQLQKSVVQKQLKYYGNVTHIFTLDQYNENDPASGDEAYLKNVTYNTWKSLKAADAEAVWMLQGWLFYSNSEFWTNARVEAYLSGVEDPNDMLILDLFSESQPQWQRLNSYYGKPWIWCQLHDYGGNVGLYGQVENVTVNPVEALANSTSLVGMGLTMEGQEGNEIMYDLLLDQAWSASPIDTATYFHNWATTRYTSNGLNETIPTPIYEAWSILLSTAYNNTNLTAATSVTKSIFELQPNTTSLLNRTGHHSTIITYDPADLVTVLNLFRSAASSSPWLVNNTAYTFDLVDLARQVLSNAFYPLYQTFVSQTNLSSTNTTTTNATAAANSTANSLLALLTSINTILQFNPSTTPSSSLPNWISAAQSRAPNTNITISNFFIYDAVNQITLWGPNGEISDYASKPWYGLVQGYYHERWRIWTQAYVKSVESGVEVDQVALVGQLLEFEEGWQTQQGRGEGGAMNGGVVQSGGLMGILEEYQSFVF